MSNSKTAKAICPYCHDGYLTRDNTGNYVCEACSKPLICLVCNKETDIDLFSNKSKEWFVQCAECVTMYALEQPHPVQLPKPRKSGCDYCGDGSDCPHCGTLTLFCSKCNCNRRVIIADGQLSCTVCKSRVAAVSQAAIKQNATMKTKRLITNGDAIQSFMDKLFKECPDCRSPKFAPSMDVDGTLRCLQCGATWYVGDKSASSGKFLYDVPCDLSCPKCDKKGYLVFKDGFIQCFSCSSKIDPALFAKKTSISSQPNESSNKEERKKTVYCRYDKGYLDKTGTCLRCGRINHFCPVCKDIYEDESQTSGMCSNCSEKTTDRKSNNCTKVTCPNCGDSEKLEDAEICIKCSSCESPYFIASTKSLLASTDSPFFGANQQTLGKFSRWSERWRGMVETLIELKNAYEEMQFFVLEGKSTPEEAFEDLTIEDLIKKMGCLFEYVQTGNVSNELLAYDEESGEGNAKEDEDDEIVDYTPYHPNMSRHYGRTVDNYHDVSIYQDSSELVATTTYSELCSSLKNVCSRCGRSLFYSNPGCHAALNHYAEFMD